MADQVTTSLAQAKILVMQGMAGKAPRINTGGEWEVFDNDTQAWVATGVYAHGQDAYSPYVSDSGYWFVWDDQNQEYVNTNVKAQGPQGDPGYTPTIEAEETTGGVIVTISDGRPSGTTEACFVRDGVSPEVTVTGITGGHTVTITDKDHPQGQSFDVMDTKLVATIIDGDTLYVDNMEVIDNYDEEEF